MQHKLERMGRGLFLAALAIALGISVGAPVEPGGRGDPLAKQGSSQAPIACEPGQAEALRASAPDAAPAGPVHRIRLPDLAMPFFSFARSLPRQEER